MHRFLLFSRIAVLFFWLWMPGAAMGLEAFIPHITGTGGFWQDYLQADNNGFAPADFTLTIYNNGVQLHVDTFTVEAQSVKLIDLKALVPTADSACGIITYQSELLYFRLAYEHRTGGGVAEFRLTGDRNPAIGFYFSDYIPEVSWKAITVANMSSVEAGVKLYAVGNGEILGCRDISLPAFSKEVGLYSKWFPKVGFNEIQAIFAESSADLCGVTISGNAPHSFLLFTPASEVKVFDTSQEIVCPEDRDDDGDRYTENQGDCDDADASIHPGAKEILDDGIDQDCDGKDPSHKDIDDDKDGYTENQGDCNDDDASIHPGAIDICGDGIDQDCKDGDCPVTDPDKDDDGFTVDEGDCNDDDASIHPGAIDICGDGIDQDCKDDDCPVTEPDKDGDGFTVDEGDCNDNDKSINPDAQEICHDGIDQNCDGKECGDK